MIPFSDFFRATDCCTGKEAAADVKVAATNRLRCPRCFEIGSPKGYRAGLMLEYVLNLERVENERCKRDFV